MRERSSTRSPTFSVIPTLALLGYTAMGASAAESAASAEVSVTVP